MVSWARGHAVTLVAVLLLVIGTGYAAKLEADQRADRAERRMQINGLACALDEWLAGTQNVLATRGLEGDPQLSKDITTVRLAALEVGGPCKEAP